MHRLQTRAVAMQYVDCNGNTLILNNDTLDYCKIGCKISAKSWKTSFLQDLQEQYET